MSGPGKGRYTTYVDTRTTDGVPARNTLLSKLFNAKSNTGTTTGDIYGAGVYDQKDLNGAAEEVRKRATANDGMGLIPSNGIQAGDLQMFPNGVDLSFGSAPKLDDVKWNNAGDPAQPYFPDLSSPGAGKTSGADKNVDPKIEITDVKPNYSRTENVLSPSDTSKGLGTSPFSKDLEKGKSSV